jgi:hypothetical protein
VADPYDQDQERVVVDCVDDAVVALLAEQVIAALRADPAANEPGAQGEETTHHPAHTTPERHDGDEKKQK